ncbi:MAG: hypothetical protein F4Y05_09025 [Acidimicrobiaceae bacterium]|nr:hypothetical protein [Acidimicrobiaceae bacterium]MYE09733.1 hypothetical protein [Acidimicrobiaceae bacterium]MYI36271.1 hypothetical protein [Acidimicrobiaceae bacterium]
MAPDQTPVIVGVSIAAPRDPDALSEPVSLMIDAARAAADDSGAAGMAAWVDLVAVAGGLWSYRNPGHWIARAIGADARTMLTTISGQTPVALLADIAERLQRGVLGAALIVGGECTRSRRRARRRGVDAPRHVDTERPPDEVWGSPLVIGDPGAEAVAGHMPRNAFALLESAIRAKRGETMAENRRRAAELCAGFAAVAADVEHSPTERAMSATEIVEVSPENRMVSWPYTKAMSANNTVDRAGALLVCSLDVAREHGVPPDRMVFPHRISMADDTDFVASRRDLAVHPGLQAAADDMLSFTGDSAGIDRFDLYACFPSMVALAVEALGIDAGRPLTVSGGLAFTGAPTNFGAGEGLIAMVDCLREDAPGITGLVHGSGGMAAKHALGLLSASPPTEPFVASRQTPELHPSALAAPDRNGPAVIDGVTVDYLQESPTVVALVRFNDGSRAWATSSDQTTVEAVTTTETVGAAADVQGGQLLLT